MLPDEFLVETQIFSGMDCGPLQHSLDPSRRDDVNVSSLHCGLRYEKDDDKRRKELIFRTMTTWKNTLKRSKGRAFAQNFSPHGTLPFAPECVKLFHHVSTEDFTIYRAWFSRKVRVQAIDVQRISPSRSAASPNGSPSSPWLWSHSRPVNRLWPWPCPGKAKANARFCAIPANSVAKTAKTDTRYSLDLSRSDWSSTLRYASAPRLSRDSHDTLAGQCCARGTTPRIGDCRYYEKKEVRDGVGWKKNQIMTTTVNQPINQPINNSINQSTNQPNQSINQSIEDMINGTHRYQQAPSHFFYNFSLTDCHWLSTHQRPVHWKDAQRTRHGFRCYSAVSECWDPGWSPTRHLTHLWIDKTADRNKTWKAWFAWKKSHISPYRISVGEKPAVFLGLRLAQDEANVRHFQVSLRALWLTQLWRPLALLQHTKK